MNERVRIDEGMRC